MITSSLHKKLIKTLVERSRLNITWRYKMKGRKAVVILLSRLLLSSLKHLDVKSVKKKVQQNGLDFVFVLYVGCDDSSKGMHATKHFVNTGHLVIVALPDKP